MTGNSKHQPSRSPASAALTTQRRVWRAKEGGGGSSCILNTRSFFVPAALNGSIRELRKLRCTSFGTTLEAIRSIFTNHPEGRAEEQREPREGSVCNCKCWSRPSVSLIRRFFLPFPLPYDIISRSLVKHDYAPLKRRQARCWRWRRMMRKWSLRCAAK